MPAPFLIQFTVLSLFCNRLLSQLMITKLQFFNYFFGVILESRGTATRPVLSKELQFHRECRSWFHVTPFIMIQKFIQILKSSIQRGERGIPIFSPLSSKATFYSVSFHFCLVQKIECNIPTSSALLSRRLKQPNGSFLQG